MRLSIIIPVYNEQQTIGEIVDRVCAAPIGDIEKEIIIANDGSSDGTRNIIAARAWSSDPRVKIYDSPINLGKGAAVRLGLHFATGDIVLIQDADLELDPNECLHLITPILDGRTSVVYGSRFLRPTAHIRLRTKLANRLLTMVTNVLFGARLTDMETAYKVMRMEVIRSIRLRAVGFDFEPELTAKLLLSGRQIIEVPIGYHPRRENEGKKIRWVDGLDAAYMLFKCRLTGGR